MVQIKFEYWTSDTMGLYCLANKLSQELDELSVLTTRIRSNCDFSEGILSTSTILSRSEIDQILDKLLSAIDVMTYTVDESVNAYIGMRTRSHHELVET